jgi:hypothetical protein
VNQLTPLLKEIQQKKYSKNAVEYNADTNTFHLIQEKVTIQELSVRTSKAEVVRFEIGVSKQKREKKETAKQKVILEEDSSEIEEQTQVEEQQQQTQVEEQTQVNESDPKYQVLWKNLDETYKNYLQKDPEWLKETMQEYMKARREGKFKEFVLPSDLLLPPLTDDQGNLDFGNETFNEIIKTLPTIQKDILKNYKPKVSDGSLDYTFLETQLKKILAQKFQLSKF